MTNKEKLDFIEKWVKENQMNEYELLCQRKMHGDTFIVDALDIYPDMEERAKSNNDSKGILQVERILPIVLAFQLSCSVNFDYAAKLPFIHVYYFV